LLRDIITARRVYLCIEFDFTEKAKEGVTDTVWTPLVRNWKAEGIEITDVCAYRELNSRKRAPNFQDSLARDTSHIVKLSLIYAILDKTTIITADHMLAAYEVTEYWERSVKWIFGTSTGNRTANRILYAIQREPGLNQTKIFDRLSRNVSKVDVD
jgi:hypothetical protein